MISMARTFGAPETVPAGRQARRASKASLSLGQLAGDVRGDVHHVAVTLDHHHVGQLDGAVLGDAADVVAAQIDQHHVLGPFLGIGQQFLGQPAVFLLVGAARARAGQRADGHLAVDHATHDLRRTADQRHARRPQEEHERAGVHDPQRAVDLERVGLDRQLSAAG